jgi:hypothetical protein
MDEQGLPYLRLAKFGRSEVELSLELESVDVLRQPPRPSLVLEHIAARRDIYPFHGVVHLSLLVNGLPAAERMAVPSDSPLPEACRQELRLPGAFFQPGLNTLTVRLHGDSMSTYRLFRAELRVD